MTMLADLQVLTVAPVVPPLPSVRFLGAPMVLDAPGPRPTYIGRHGELGVSHVGRATLLIARLALGGPATVDQLRADLWPGVDTAASTLTTLVSRTRRWLGRDEAGDLVLRYGGRDGVPLRVHNLRSDWDDFKALIGTQGRRCPAWLTSTDLAGIPEATLWEALELVDAAPLAGVRGERWAWSEPARAQMTAAVSTVAQEAARRALSVRNIDVARWASAIGRMVDPGREECWRLALATERTAGNLPALDRITTELRDLTSVLGGGLEPETWAAVSAALALTGKDTTPWS